MTGPILGLDLGTRRMGLAISDSEASIAFPAGYLPRSGLAARHGIALVNSPGLIDSGYRGEVRVLLLNTDGEVPFLVETGDRIAQLLLVPFVEAEPFEVPELTESERGDGGFGSSG